MRSAMAANFLVALEAAASKLTATAGVTREQLAPLVLATARQWAELGPERALTGPIARGDAATVRKHLDALASEPATRALYAALSLAAVELARGNGTSDEALGEIRRALLADR